IWLFRGGRVHTGTNAAALRAGLQRGTCSLVPGRLTALAHKLIKGRHAYPFLERSENAARRHAETWPHAANALLKIENAHSGLISQARTCLYPAEIGRAS